MMNEDMIDLVTKAMRRSWNLGQIYWQQADSEAYRQQDKSAETEIKFENLVDEVSNALRDYE